MGGATHRRWVKAYFRYAATSARVSGYPSEGEAPIQEMGTRQMGFFSSLLD